MVRGSCNSTSSGRRTSGAWSSAHCSWNYVRCGNGISRRETGKATPPNLMYPSHASAGGEPPMPEICGAHTSQARGRRSRRPVTAPPARDARTRRPAGRPSSYLATECAACRRGGGKGAPAHAACRRRRRPRSPAQARQRPRPTESLRSRSAGGPRTSPPAPFALGSHPPPPPPPSPPVCHAPTRLPARPPACPSAHPAAARLPMRERRGRHCAGRFFRAFFFFFRVALRESGPRVVRGPAPSQPSWSDHATARRRGAPWGRPRLLLLVFFPAPVATVVAVSPSCAT